MDLQNEFEAEKYTLLIVDDNPTNLGVMLDYLKRYGFKMMVARDGEGALKRARYAKPDIILLDVMMPGIDGFETCRQLKADETTRHIPVIFMTALAGSDDKVKGFEVGAVDYVTKPLYQEEVLARLITHLKIKDLTQKLQSANEELNRANANKDKFFSIIAHDLKGPFQPLLGMSELLAFMTEEIHPVELRDRIEEAGALIHRSAKNVYNLLENLLQWSQIQMNRIEYKPDNLDLTRMVQGNIQLLVTNATNKDIMLQNNVSQELFVYVDENMISTVIRNLISNALKFTPLGGQVTIKAEVRNQPSPPNLVEIAVIDTGVGIKEENLNKLFKIEVHHSTVGTAREQGTGLGLIICKEMVEKNGGKIWVESEFGKGTTIKFTVPLLD